MNDPDTVIRRARPEDLDDIVALDQLLFRHDAQFDPTLRMDWSDSPAGRGYFLDRIGGDDGFVLVAVRDNRVVGYLCGGLVETDDSRIMSRIAELECMVVDPSARSGGLGGRLVLKFLAWAREKGMPRVRVVASAGNEGAIRFYRRMGFKDFDLALEQEL